jgi:hypothetical protein
MNQFNEKEVIVKESTKFKKGLYATLALLGGIYAINVGIQSQKLSKELDPLRDKLEYIASEVEPEVVTTFNESLMKEVNSYDYGGRVDAINEIINQFAKDNNAYALNWGIVGESKKAKTPMPLALSPKSWRKDIDNSAIYK